MTMKGQSIPSLTYDFEMSPQARYRHAVPIENNSGAPIKVKGIKVVTNAKITDPGQFLSPYWNKVITTVNADNTLYTYTINFDTPLTIPQNKTSLLEYDIGDCLGPIQKVPMPPQDIQIFDGTTWVSLDWTKDSAPHPRPHPNYILQMDHANWGQYRQKDPRTMANEPWNLINRLCYAFIGFDETGAVFTLDSWADQLELPPLYKQKRTTTQDDPNTLKTTIAFGGWTNAGKRMDTVFSQMAADPIARQRFVNNAVSAAKSLGADGIDIDWEYPESPHDAENYVLLLEELRTELQKRIGYQAILTIDGPAGSDKITVFSKDQWGRIGNAVTQIGVMCYDYFGAWDPWSDFHAAWQLSDNSPHKQVGSKYDIASTLALYQQNGIPPNKILMGVPSYARAVIVAQPGSFGGLYQPVVGAPAGEYSEAGFYSWNAINNVLNKQPSALDDLGIKDTDWFLYDSDHPYCQKAQMSMLTGCLPDGRWVTLNFLDQKAGQKRGELIKQLNLVGAMEWANYCEPVEAKNTFVQSISNGLDKATKLETKVELAVPKTKAFEKTSIKNRVKDYVNKLKAFFGSKTKAKILNELNTVSNFDQMGQLLKHKDKGEKLRTHRNLFKRFFSWILPKGTIAEPRSYRLAQELYQTKQLFEVKYPPSKIIAGALHQPSVVVQNSYEAVLRKTGDSDDKLQQCNSDAQSSNFKDLKPGSGGLQYAGIVNLKPYLGLVEDKTESNFEAEQPGLSTTPSAPILRN